jgi:osmotically-inducible protein OsmY
MRTFLVATMVLLSSGSMPVLAAEPCTKSAVHEAARDDRRTTDEVRRRIAGDESVSALAPVVTVTTTDGVVTLRGAVGSSEDRMVLASLAESAPGVRHVDDRLEIRP